MPLMPFTIPSHIPLILSGTKRQTTRAPRKNPLKLGDTLYCYYKPRQKKGCRNCIQIEKGNCWAVNVDMSPCTKHNNFFGEAKITGILHLNNVFSMNGNRLDYETQLFKLAEKWIDGFDMQSEKFMEAWAKADGFLSLQEAHEYFSESTKNSQWMFLPWDVIIFELASMKGVIR